MQQACDEPGVQGRTVYNLLRVAELASRAAHVTARSQHFGSCELNYAAEKIARIQELLDYIEGDTADIRLR